MLEVVENGRWMEVAGLGEEPGLRGYALARGQSRYGALLASLIVEVLWAG